MRNYIGSGHIAAIVGVSKWSSPAQVWLELTDANFDSGVNGNPHITAGILLEPVIAQNFANEKGFPLEKGTLIKHKDKEYLGATPDYVFEQNGVKCILECKNTANGQNFKDEPPEEYTCQVQWQMHICDIDVAYIHVLIDGWQFKTFLIERDRKLGEILEAHATKFWQENVLQGIRPPLDNSNDKTLDYLFNPISNGKEIVFPLNSELLIERDELKTQIKLLEEKVKAIDNSVKISMEDAEFAVTNDLQYKIKCSIIKQPEKVIKAFEFKKITISKITDKQKQKLLEGKK